MTHSDLRRSFLAVLAMCAPAAADVVQSEWIGPSPGLWSDARRWSGGVVPNNGGGASFAVTITKDIGGPSAVTLASGAPVIDTLTIGSSAWLGVSAGTALTVAQGSISNDGTIHLAHDGAASALKVSASETLLHGAGSITGAGLWGRIVAGASGARLVNSASHSIRGSLWIGTDSPTLRLTNLGLIEADAVTPLALWLPESGTSNFNQGFMRAIDGGTLAIVTGTIDNHGGVIEAGAGSTVRFGSLNAVVGGGDVHVRGGVIRAVENTQPGTLLVTRVLVLSEGVEVEGSVRVESPSGGGLSGIAVGENTSYPSIIELKGTASNQAVVAAAGPIAVIEDCTIIGASSPGTNRVIGTWTSNKGVFAASTRFEGSIDLGFALGIDHHGVIDIPSNGALSITQSGAPFAVKPSGVVRIASATQPPWTFAAAWHARVENFGAVEVGTGRKIQMVGQAPGAADYAQAGGVTRLDGQINLPNASALLVTGGVLSGSGECKGMLSHDAGVLDPAGIDGVPATFTVTGSYAQGAEAVLRVDLGAAADTASNPGDRLAVTGTATLAGTLRVRFVESFVPTPGESFTVLTASSVSGAFGAVDSCVPVNVSYASNAVTVTVAAASPADLNGDGVVNGADLAMLLGAWGPCTTECRAADIDHDGDIDGADLAFLLGSWS